MIVHVVSSWLRLPAGAYVRHLPPVHSPLRRLLFAELAVVLTVTFATTGVRSAARLISALLAPVPLNQQQVVIHTPQSSVGWLEVLLQLTSSVSLLAWGGLAWLLLSRDGVLWRQGDRTDVGWGVLLAAIVGIPGLGLYAMSLQFGWTKQVIPSALTSPFAEIPLLLLAAAAAAVAEEMVVVGWLCTRLAQLRWHAGWIVLCSAVLRGSYHLYQGISAGFGNLAMGLLFGWVFLRTGRVWPLVIAHFVLDVVAFIGPVLFSGQLSFVGL
ncbi:CPBP family intramembrane glutamic endopeptidase [Corynebacterium choanae]|uniref:CAAX amino terminal protease self-immunity n=1 Tax=Corynebacterium choanae TaxID=1862358 RepID=A0A3G6J3K6_9CORY|nr:CPBP family intramembrane glutamic endopeptidase [Corynebacterium choanae]AZA12522.1 CAAX amino terminal protease self- immunity [Corynebacterium choanae]